MLGIARRRIPGLSVVIEDEDDSAVVHIKRPEDPKASTFRFSRADAEQANLANKKTFRQYPRAMLRWRALADGLRVMASDALMGIYPPEEIGAEVNENGEPFQPAKATVIEQAGDDQRPGQGSDADVAKQLVVVAQRLATHAPNAGVLVGRLRKAVGDRECYHRLWTDLAEIVKTDGFQSKMKAERAEAVSVWFQAQKEQ